MPFCSHILPSSGLTPSTDLLVGFEIDENFSSTGYMSAFQYGTGVNWDLEHVNAADITGHILPSTGAGLGAIDLNLSSKRMRLGSANPTFSAEARDTFADGTGPTFSVSFWLRPRNNVFNPSINAILSIGNNTNGGGTGTGFLLYNDGTAAGNPMRLLLQTFNGSNTEYVIVSGTEKPVMNSWNHIVITHDARFWQAYVNGTFADDGTGTFDPAQPTGTSGDSLPTFSNAGSIGVTGYNELDQLTVWPRVIGAQEVSEIYNAAAGLNISNWS